MRVSECETDQCESVRLHPNGLGACLAASAPCNQPILLLQQDDEGLKESPRISGVEGGFSSVQIN